MSTPASYLPLAEQDFPSEHAALAQAFHTRATWLWTHEDEPYQPPYAPPGSERGFRWTYTSTLPSRTPSSITIVISVDNYFALHVNGALVHSADSRDEFWDAFAFTVPIAAGSTRTVVAVRGVNADDTGAVLNNPAGFTAAIKISFQGTTETETFVTGPNMQWVGESSLPVGWENPEFNDSSWPNVVVYPIEHYHRRNDYDNSNSDVNASCDFEFIESYDYLYHSFTTLDLKHTESYLFHSRHPSPSRSDSSPRIDECDGRRVFKQHLQ
ncbi:hypothetical protein EST38_g6760 [Candolleomyces aberdarensis]|uniref:Uncharacterized protein n=1 Tax=Candolleomyces aberdarensis TaxID=2316362 RepID=A0A4Q2DIU5_9AGAR|nr:hypothetical protein EST38_g6760 [Candolleomyces aberdarensis]